MIIRNHILLSQADYFVINSNAPATNEKETEMGSEDHSEDDSDMDSDDGEILAHAGRGKYYGNEGSEDSDASKDKEEAMEIDDDNTEMDNNPEWIFTRTASGMIVKSWKRSFYF